MPPPALLVLHVSANETRLFGHYTNHIPYDYDMIPYNYDMLTRSVLTKFRVRTGMSKGNQIDSSNLWTLGIPKMYMGTLGYNIQISL